PRRLRTEVGDAQAFLEAARRRDDFAKDRAHVRRLERPAVLSRDARQHAVLARGRIDRRATALLLRRDREREVRSAGEQAAAAGVNAVDLTTGRGNRSRARPEGRRRGSAVRLPAW